MAIYSLRLTPIGKTTQKRPYTAAAHVRYITRKEAMTLSMAERMPEIGSKAVRWFKAQEKADRKNARVADKMIIALPRELNAPQQAELIHSFAETLTQGRASWFGAIHAKGKDRDNPHCHLIVRDRDIVTGRRVVMFSAGAKEIKQRWAKGEKLPTTLRMIRELWELHANAALTAAGRTERIDRRTLAEQGIGRQAQVHEGPNIRAMHQRGYRPRSQDRQVRNRAMRKSGTPPTRTVRYGDIDRGRTRAEFNDALRSAGSLTLTERMRLNLNANRAAGDTAHLQPALAEASARPRTLTLTERMRLNSMAQPARPVPNDKDRNR